jgi:hypothetical protein
MSHGRRIAQAMAGIGFLLLAGFSPLQLRAPPPATEPAKLGFSYLTAAQLKELWRLTENYALAEVFLRSCGASPNIERRMRLAARDCIEPWALNRVAAYFRKKVSELAGKHTFVCESDQSKALVKTTRTKIDRAVQEVRSMCRSCFFC